MLLQLDPLVTLVAGEEARNRKALNPNAGALIIRIGFWGRLYYNYNKRLPKIV